MFPCNGKLPMTEHGFQDASCELGQIRSWWEANPDANIAVATGNGLMVLDVDPEHGGDKSLKVLLDEHGDVATAVVETGGGGSHYWFRVPDGVEVRNSAGKLGPGLDVRGDGGYVIVPPSLHASGKRYAWRNESNANGIAPAPEWLLELVRKPKRPSPPAMPIRELVDCDGTLYGVAALEAETERVRAAPQGQRNHTLNRAAFALGQLEAGRELASGVAEDELRSAALGAGLPEWEIERTLASGLNAGTGEATEGGGDRRRLGPRRPALRDDLQAHDAHDTQHG